MTTHSPIIWPILVYGGLVLVLVTGMIGLSYVLGERHSKPGRNIPYESGIQPLGSARVRYDVRYYLVGVFFILFDVEGAIIFAWAVAARRLGWPGYFGAVLFILTLVVGLVYVWKLGGLDWYESMIHENQEVGEIALDKSRPHMGGDS